MKHRCILFHFYIKPQRKRKQISAADVVSYSISTSNHNPEYARMTREELYLIPFLHQTTTNSSQESYSPRLYLIPFLHQTTTILLLPLLHCPLYLIPFLHQTTTLVLITCIFYMLYLIPFLHQTTTTSFVTKMTSGCILFHFYIKPQPCRF